MNPEYTRILLFAGLVALVSVVLLLRAVLRRRRLKSRHVLLDGSNVMHWKDGTPQIAPLRDAIACLNAHSRVPSVVFDANAGYLLTGKYRHHGAMARLVGLPEKRVMVVPKATSADKFLLMAARDFNAPIVTNDRYRDWKEEFPEIAEPGRLIRGGYRGGALWLEGMP